MKVLKRLRTLAALIAGVAAFACTGSAQAAMSHAAAIVDTRAAVLAEMLPKTCGFELTADRVLQVKLSANINGTVTLPEDFGVVEFVLNDHTIAGTDGADADGETPATDGQPAVVIPATTFVTFTGQGTVIGGNGGKPDGGGAPAAADVDGNKIENPSVTAGTTVTFTDGEDALPVAEGMRITAIVPGEDDASVRLTAEITFRGNISDQDFERWVKAGKLNVLANKALSKLADSSTAAVEWTACSDVTCVGKKATVTFVVAKPSEASGFYRLTDVQRDGGGVQLWEGGPYFAQCNVGATKPEEYGYYFWWGDTEGYVRNAADDGWVSTKTGASFAFSDGNCPTYGKDNSTLQSQGYIDSFDSTGNLLAKYDAATAHLGAPWRMPTDAEISALISNCTPTWTNNWNGTGVNGRLVTGKGAYASKSIFLPAAGYGYDSYFYCLGLGGGYWSSTPSSDNSDIAWYLDFGSSDFYRYGIFRYYGQSVRPVRDAK